MRTGELLAGILMMGLVYGLTLDIARSQDRQVPEAAGEIRLSFAPVVKRAAPAVVNVYATRLVRDRRSPFAGDPFFERFFGDRGFGLAPRRRAQNSLGSGVIVEESGIVVTNFHVIRDATDVRVALNDRREFEAEIILRDERTDLAILQIDTAGERFPALSFARAESVEVGDLVLAIGNPFGVGQTVTQGIVSALARTQAGITDSNFFIQTDAAINPGNSGGALLDINGDVVGINTAIYSRSGGSNGIGFAIPSDMVRLVVDSALQGSQTVLRPWIGAEFQNVTADLAIGLGLERPRGVLVTEIFPESPADKAGLDVGDLIVSVGEQGFDDIAGLNYRLATIGIGNTARLGVIRDGRERALNVALSPAPETVPRDERLIGGFSPFTGSIVANLSPAVADELRLRGADRGVVILDVEPGSNAARLGLRKGDVIVRVANRDIRDTRTLEEVTARERRVWRFAINRGGRLITSVVGG
ncbi:MAG: DegQ family serine endoprotease [Pseudomonadota bacterium]